MTKYELQQIPEYIALNPKQKKYMMFTRVWDRTPYAACKLLKIKSITRFREHPDVLRCEAALDRMASKALIEAGMGSQVVGFGNSKNLSEYPQETRLAVVYEAARRLERNEHGRLLGFLPEDPLFANVAIHLADGRVLVPDSQAARFLKVPKEGLTPEQIEELKKMGAIHCD